MKIGITGSRCFTDKDLIEKEILNNNPTAIFAGGAKGADTIAKNCAHKHGIQYKEFLPKFKTDPNTKYHARWYLERNKEIVQSCDILIAFWDGKSKGTKHTIDFAKKINKPMKIITN